MDDLQIVVNSESSKFKAKVIHDRLMIQYIREGVIYASEDHFIFKSHDGGARWEEVCRLKTRKRTPFGRFKYRVLHSEIVRKLARNIGIHNAVVLKSGTVLMQFDGIYRYNGRGKHADYILDFGKHKIIGPLKNGFVVDDRTSNVYFGEYNNSRPYAVRIFRGTNDGRKWEMCYRFPEGRVKHVHSIVPDPYRKRIWVCTGDNDQESGLFYTDDDFQTLELFGGGEQSWRIVSLIPTEKAIYWGSDAGQDAPGDFKNYLYKWDFGKKQKKQLVCIDKPAYYSTQLKNGTMIIGVTYEPKIRRKVEKTAELWASADGEQWEKIIDLPFQPSNRTIGTKYATICLPLGDGTVSLIFFTPLNTKKYDFKLLCAELIQIG